MPTSPLRRSTRRAQKKKKDRWDSIEDHINTRNIKKATRDTAQTKLDNLSSLVDSLQNQSKKGEFNADPAIIKERADLTAIIVDAQSSMNQQEGYITAIKVLIVNDDDYAADEKQDAIDAATNWV